MSDYHVNSRHRRGHRRVDRQGTERFEVDDLDGQDQDGRESVQQSHDDDQRILSELPPHWGLFSERDREVQ